ncbi:MAG TPA: prepilin-type N-terminal cleavage/methylation domain-containing protein [Pseudomonadales bacterium]|nr:prepilin-type N-terminal cleavage/methylation domain-containing protein [Pseudomonadales bacterium]
MLHNGRENAFTLIELLVVIAIIAILAALLMPVLSAAKGYSRTVGCKNHLRQMGYALQMYVHDNQDQYPRYLGPGGPSNGDADGAGGRAVGLVYWSSKLFPYDSQNWTNRSFHCPGYVGAITRPYIKGAIDRQGSYGYNIAGVCLTDATNEYLGLGPVSFWKNAQGKFVSPISASQLSAPSQMLAIGDSFMKAGGAGASDAWGCGTYASEYAAEPFAPRHGKNYNVLLCDGHVSSISPWILFNPSNSAAMWNYDHQPHPEMWMQ